MTDATTSVETKKTAIAVVPATAPIANRDAKTKTATAKTAASLAKIAHRGLLPHEPNVYALVTPIVTPRWLPFLKNFNSWAANFLATASPGYAPKSLNKTPQLKQPANQPSPKPSC
jgi:hypothetical protein